MRSTQQAKRPSRRRFGGYADLPEKPHGESMGLLRRADLRVGRVNSALRTGGNLTIRSSPFNLVPTVQDRGAFKVGTVRYPRLVARDADCATRLKDRTLTKLYNQRPPWLADCHARLDATVAVAYGWPADLSDESILERLLALNRERTG